MQIFCLVKTGKIKRVFIGLIVAVDAFQLVIIHSVACGDNIIFLFSKKYRRIFFLCFVSKNCFCFRCCFPDNYRYSRFNNSRFFYCNFLKCVSQNIHVVKSNIGNDRNFRNYNICTVKPATQAGFNYGNVNFLFSKVFKRHYKSEFKK